MLAVLALCQLPPAEQCTSHLVLFLKESPRQLLKERHRCPPQLGVGAPIKDVVICCPGYYTMFQRAAILDAGKIAGLNIVALYNEHAALALQYGISKQDLCVLPPGLARLLR